MVRFEASWCTRTKMAIRLFECLFVSAVHCVRLPAHHVCTCSLLGTVVKIACEHVPISAGRQAVASSPIVQLGI